MNERPEIRIGTRVYLSAMPSIRTHFTVIGEDENTYTLANNGVAMPVEKEYVRPVILREYKGELHD